MLQKYTFHPIPANIYANIFFVAYKNTCYIQLDVSCFFIIVDNRIYALDLQVQL